MDNALKLLYGALTPLIAIFAVWIAYQQHRTNRRKAESDERLAQQKQRFDLYERRLTVFDAAMDLIATTQAMPEEKQQWSEPELYLRKAIFESYFLFDRDIVDYLWVLDAKYQRFMYFAKRAVSSGLRNEEKLQKSIDEAEELERWFADQFEDAQKRFSSYLSLRELGGTPSLGLLESPRKKK